MTVCSKSTWLSAIRMFIFACRKDWFNWRVINIKDCAALLDVSTVSEEGRSVESNSQAAASLSAQACFSSSSNFWLSSLLEVWSSSSLARDSCSCNWVWDRASWDSLSALLVWASSAWVTVRLFWVSVRDVWRFDWVLSASLFHCDLRACEKENTKMIWNVKSKWIQYGITLKLCNEMAVKKSKSLSTMMWHFYKPWPVSLRPAFSPWQISPEPQKSPTAASAHLNIHIKSKWKDSHAS